MNDALLAALRESGLTYDCPIRVVDMGTYSISMFGDDDATVMPPPDAGLIAEVKEILPDRLLSKQVNSSCNDRKTYAFMALTHYCDQNNINLPTNIIKNMAELAAF